MPKAGASSKPSKPHASPSKSSPSKAPPPTPTSAKSARTPASGTVVVQRDHVEVQDPVQATRLYQKGFIGEPQPGNRLRLSLVEAAWLCTQGRLDVPGGAAGLLAHGAAQGNRTEIEFLAYSDLRARGLVVRHDPPPATAAGDGGHGGLRVWPRGEGPPRAHDYQVQVCAEGDVVSEDSLLAAAEAGGLLAVVDQDGAVTHYKVESETPKGQHPPGDLPAAQGVLLADRVLVPETDAARAYAEQEFLGTASPAGLVLSLTEAASLVDRGVLHLARIANKADPTLVQVHGSLRGAGVVVKSGFRFGTHLRGYEGDPEEGHAKWLIHCLAGGAAMHWSELSRGIRLAHGVRKRFLVALPRKEGVAFVALTWFKP